MKNTLLAAVVLGVATGLAGAQAPSAARPGRPAGARMPRVAGQITKVAGHVYTVKERRGASVNVTVPAGTPIMKTGREKATTKDLKVGVNIAAMGKANGATAFTANRVMIMPPMTMGTVVSITSTKITVKTAAGKTVSYTINSKTRLPKGPNAVKTGEKVTVGYSGSTALMIRPARMGGMGGGMRPGGRRGRGANGQPR
jgi:hypothetical protein